MNPILTKTSNLYKKFYTEIKHWENGTKSYKTIDIFIPINIIQEIFPVRINYKPKNKNAVIIHESINEYVAVENGCVRLSSIMTIIASAQLEFGKELIKTKVKKCLDS